MVAATRVKTPQVALAPFTHAYKSSLPSSLNSASSTPLQLRTSAPTFAGIPSSSKLDLLLPFSFHNITQSSPSCLTGTLLLVSIANILLLHLHLIHGLSHFTSSIIHRSSSAPHLVLSLPSSIITSSHFALLHLIASHPLQPPNSLHHPPLFLILPLTFHYHHFHHFHLHHD